MAFNDRLLAAVKGSPTIGIKENRIKALDSLLIAKNASELRIAVLATGNYDYWFAMDNTIKPIGCTVSGSPFLNLSMTLGSGQDPYLSEEFLDNRDGVSPSLMDIVKVAAEERVKESLADVETDVLIGILKHNDKDCREYLQRKLEPEGVKLANIHGWDPATEFVFSKPALNRIKKEAVNVLLLNLLSDDVFMNKPELKDPQLYQNLASRDIRKIKDAVTKIVTVAGAPLTVGDVVSMFEHENDLNNEVIAQAEERGAKILKQANDILLNALSNDTLIANNPTLNAPELYEKLSSTKLTDIKTAVRTIVTAVPRTDLQGFSVENIVNAITNSNDLTDKVKKASDRNKKVLDERSVDEFKRQFAAFVREKITDEGLLNNRDLLNKDSVIFLDAVLKSNDVIEESGKPYKERVYKLSEGEIKKIAKEVQDPLCARYLQAKLLKEGVPRNLAAILQAKNEGEVAMQLKVALDEHEHIVNHAVTAQNFELFQLDLVKNYIRKMGEDFDPRDRDAILAKLESLGKATDLQDFKTKLARVVGVINVDFIKGSDLDALKKEIFIQHFQLRVDKDSRLGKNAHSELINVFRTLPIETQKKLVETPKISLLTNPTDANVLKHYLGLKETDNVAALVSENKRNAAFKKIHNSAIARALADYNPLLSLTPTQVQEINTAIGDANNSLFAFNQYKDLIDVIKNQCNISGPQEVTAFNKVFNINPSGDNFIDSTADSSYEGIIYQHDYNENLLADTSLDENLRNVLLRIAKPGGIFDNSDIQDIKKKFKKSKNINEFFEQWPKLPPPKLNDDEKALKSAVMKELTPDLFHEIKIEQKNKLFNAPKGVQQAEFIKDAKESLKDITKYNRTLIDIHNQSLIDLRRLEESHSHTLALGGKEQKEILTRQEQYKNLNTDCINIVSKLKDNLREIEALKIPIPLPTDADENVKKSAIALNKELDKQKKLIEDGIKAYIDLAEKTAKRLREIEALNKQQIFTPKGFKVFRLERSLARNPQETVSNPTDPNQPKDPRMIIDREADKLSRIVSSGPDKELFRRTEKPGSNEVICFDSSEERQGFKNQDGTDNNNRYRMHSRFTYDPVSQKFEMQFLQGTMPNSQKIPPGNLRDDLVDMTMNMVMQELLKRLDNNNPPSKDDPITLVGIKQRPYEVEYLYAACRAFGISSDAILVKGTAGFNPESQIDRGYTKTSDKPDSTYCKYFQENNGIMSQSPGKSAI